MIRVLMNVILKRPILIIFDVTKRCNQRCAFCNIWKAESADMDLAQIEAQAKRLRKFGAGYVFIQGGEPTLRKDLIPIIDIFIKNKIKPTVITNGILLSDELASQIASRKCNLAVSIDSPDREEFARIRGADCLEKVKGNVISASKFRKRNGNWAITTTVTGRTTMADVLALERFADDNGFMYAVRPYIFVKGTAGKINEEMAYQDRADNSGILEIFEYARKKAYRTNYLAALVYEEHIRYIRHERMPSCDAAKYSFLMQENGNISPCIEFPDILLELDDFSREKKKYRDVFCRCNENTPCFYNDAREIGVVWRKKLRIFFHLPLIVKQMIRYGNFF
jgi:MoaA/NifB/PqqE/SkfB family radical SAM enzyme